MASSDDAVLRRKILIGQIVKEILSGMSLNHSEDAVRKLFEEIIADKWRAYESDSNFDGSVELYAEMASDFIREQSTEALHVSLSILVAYASALPQRNASSESPTSKEAVKKFAAGVVGRWIDDLPVSWPDRHRPRKAEEAKQKEREALRLAIIEAMATCLRFRKKPTYSLVVSELNNRTADEERIKVTGLKSRIRRYALGWREMLSEAKKRVSN